MLGPTNQWTKFSTSESAELADGTWTLSSRMIIGCLFGVIVVAGLLGNSLIVAAIARRRRLHTRGNFLIGSLAVADLLVCLLVAPYSAMMTLHEFGPLAESGAWRPPRVTCHILIFLDVTCCTASILHLCAIAYDRYATITSLRCTTRTTFLRVFPYIVIIWAAASLLSIAPYFVFPDSVKSNDVIGEANRDDVMQTEASEVNPPLNANATFAIPSPTAPGSSQKPQENDDSGLSCVVNTNRVYRVVATTCAFYAPLTFIIIIYIRVFNIAWKRVHMPKSPLEREVLAMAQQIGRSMSHMSVSDHMLGSSAMKGLEAQDSFYSQSEDDSSVFTLIEEKFLKLLIFLKLKKPKEESVTKEPTPEDMLGTKSPNQEGNNNQNNQSTPPKTKSQTVLVVEDNGVVKTKTTSCCKPRLNYKNLLGMKRSNSLANPVEAAIGQSILTSQQPATGLASQQPSNVSSLQKQSLSEFENLKPLLSPATARTRCDSLGFHERRLSVSFARRSSLSDSAKHRASSVAMFGKARTRIRLQRERKIIKTVGMVIGAFVVCWLPFFLKELILPFCVTCSLAPSVELFINWLGYVNSALNPFIYAYSNEEFNKAFKILFKDISAKLCCSK